MFGILPLAAQQSCSVERGHCLTRSRLKSHCAWSSCAHDGQRQKSCDAHVQAVKGSRAQRPHKLCGVIYAYNFH
eukprot:263878-Pyramimonas_sp.AAC.4